LTRYVTLRRRSTGRVVFLRFV